MPPYEAPPGDLDIRRDALLLRVVGLRESVKDTDLDIAIVSKELEELATRVQKVEGTLDMTLFERTFDTLEKLVDSKKY